MLKAALASPDLASHGDKDGKLTLAAISKDAEFSTEAVTRGDSQVAPVGLPDGTRAIALMIPFVKSAADPKRFSHSLLAIISQVRFARAFADNDLVTSFLVDSRGRLLAHPDASLMNGAKSLAQLPIVSQMMQESSATAKPVMSIRFPERRNSGRFTSSVSPALE